MIDSFDFATGRILARKYEIISKLGYGWEGEVYKLLEIETGIERAGKFFFPERNLNNRTLKFYAKKLHKLRRCGILIHYNTQEQITFRSQKISFLVSEFVEGSLLQEFLDNKPGKRLDPFQGLHLLYALAKGMECIHNQKEYHGDLHTENIIVTRFGLSFDLKIIDLFHLKLATTANMLTDVYDLVRLFYDVIGGARTYAKQPKAVKGIICGLKKSLIKKKFRNAGQMRTYLENMSFGNLPG